MWLTRLVQLKFQQCGRAIRQAGDQLRRSRFDPQFDPAVRAKACLAHFRFDGVIRCQGCDAIRPLAGQNQIKRRGLKGRLSRCLTKAVADLHPAIACHTGPRPCCACDIDNRLSVTRGRARHQNQQVSATAPGYIAKANLPGAGETIALQQRARSGQGQVGTDLAAQEAGPFPLPVQHQAAVQHRATRPQAARQRAHLWRHPRYSCHSGGGQVHQHRTPEKQECH